MANGYEGSRPADHTLLIQAAEFLSSSSSCSCWQRKYTSAFLLSVNAGPGGACIGDGEELHVRFTIFLLNLI
jgi:hypothetical protein